jgi:cephalosporin-C deacetylase
MTDGLTPYVPEDFDAFWAEALAEALAAPLDFRRKPQGDKQRDGMEIEVISFRSISGSTLHGWIAYPEGARRCPSFLWIPPYSRWSMMPNEYGTREGFCSLSFNFFGEAPFHEEVYTPERGYMADGAFEPSEFVFRRMAQDAVIAFRVLEAQLEVDEDRIGSMGMSQGGGMSIWLAAMLPKRVKAVVADMPFFGGLPWVFSKPVMRYPLRELADVMNSVSLGKERVLYTLSYFDTMNWATRCTVPTLVTAGLKDPAVRTQQVEAIFEALAGEKEMVSIDWGHDLHPSMVERNRDWLLKHLVSEPSK